MAIVHAVKNASMFNPRLTKGGGGGYHPPDSFFPDTLKRSTFTQNDFY